MAAPAAAADLSTKKPTQPNNPAAPTNERLAPPQNPHNPNDSAPNPHHNFYIFGQNIAFSKSPHMHNAAFAHHNLPNHLYSIREVEHVSDCGPYIASEDFKGASVTMPFKLQISQFCDEVTDEARLVGAVNTLSVRESAEGRPVVRGDNTDWSGLLQCITTRYPGYDDGGVVMKPRVGWVIGAGGASRAAVYALHKSGVEEIYISNRTFSRAQAIAEDFAGHFQVVPIERWEEMDGHPADVIIGTVPADTVDESAFAGVEWKGEGGLCIDMSYKPRVTPLMRIAQGQEGWATANGLDALLEQGLIQFKIWTGLEAPREVMSAAIQ